MTPIWPGVANTGEHINIENIQNIDVFFKEDKRLPYCHKTVDTNIFHNVSYYYYWCPSSKDASGELLLPDLNINVDFGPLLTGLSGIFPYSARVQLPLVIGLSNDTFFDYTHTVPVTFIPGINMAAPYTLGLRQIYTNGILAALGIFEVSELFNRGDTLY